MPRVLSLLLVLTAALTSVFAQNPPAAAPTAAAPAAPKMPRGPKPGDVAPDFTVKGPDGADVKLSDFRGKVVLLDLWATWCGPCVAAMPKNSALAEKHAGDGLVVLAVCASDTRENYDGWVQRNAGKYRFLTAHDPAGKEGFRESTFHRNWGVSMFPSYFVIGRDGRVVGRAAGGGPNENPAVLRLLAQAGLPVAAPAAPTASAPKS